MKRYPISEKDQQLIQIALKVLEENFDDEENGYSDDDFEDGGDL